MRIDPVSFADVDITGGFWLDKQTLNRNVTLRSVREQFEKTGRFAAFRFDWQEGMPQKPHIFWDSDIAKWLESAAYVLQKHPDDTLQSYAESVIDQIELHQEKNGYFNIYFTVVEPDARFTRRLEHELYCAGHLTEAAVAYYYATGRRRFLDLMCRYIDLIDRTFRIEQSASFATPGHEEIELALIKLYQCTGEKRYLDLCMFFLDTRGTGDPKDEIPGWTKTYFQDHLPVRQQTTAEGHAVRACYLYCAMADAARITGDKALRQAAEAIFDNIIQKRMYITGGIGSSADGERFTGDYDLPNDSAYAETCAAIALALFGSRMSLLSPDGKYADTVERAMYNGVLSGLSLDGKAFFYENPLAIDLSQRKANACRDCHFPLTERVEVFSCSCCPPNLTRFIASAGNLLYAQSEDTVFVYQYMHSTARVGGGTLTQETDYPASGMIRLHASHLAGKTLALRIPGWCGSYTLSCESERTEKGYIYLTVPSDDFVCTLELEMQPVFMEATPLVGMNMGKVALQYGPVVYCLEGVDNGDLHGLCADLFEPITQRVEETLGVPMLEVDGWRKHMCNCCRESLYRPAQGDYRRARLRFIPYYAFANRGESDMTVWVTKF